MAKKCIDTIKREVKKILSMERFLHSEAVAQTAKELAEQWQLDTRKAYLAGILHDIAKEISLEEMQSYLCAEEICPEEWLSKNLLHSKVGAIIAKEAFGIEDSEILAAIRNHTIGGENLEPLSKILYIADFIAPGRKQAGVNEVRKLAKIDLDRALLEVYSRTILYLENKGYWIHPASLAGYQAELKKIKERRQN
jgi:putative HD superfamily hydrolase of NAD metabolism